MPLNLLVGLLPYWNYTNIGISPFLDAISFWNFLEAFLGCLYTCSKQFWISCLSISWLTSLLKLYKYRDISSSGWFIFLIFFDTFLGYFCTISKIFCISCVSVSLSLGFLYLFQLVISVGQLLRPLVLLVWLRLMIS